MTYDSIKSSLTSIRNNINNQSINNFSLEQINNINNLIIDAQQKLHTTITGEDIFTLIHEHNFKMVVQEESFDKIVAFILELAQGDYSKKIEINGGNELVSSLSMAANLLAEELQWKSDKINESNSKLVEKSHFISNITEAISDIIYIASVEDSETMFINKSINAFLGHDEFTQADPKIHNIIALSHPDDHKKIKEDFSKIKSLIKGQKIKTEFRIRKADGSWLWAYREIVPFKYDHNGNLLEVLGKLTDITEIKQKEQSFNETAERLKALNEASTDAIIIADKHQKILSWSNGATTLFGYTELEAVGKLVELIIPEEYSSDHEKAFDFAVKRDSSSKLKPRTIELKAVNKKGIIFPVEINLSAWRIKENIYFGAIIRDISKSKAHEKFLIASNNEKEVMLREIHHRVKNNLQIVNSMLDIQIRKSQDYKVKEALENSRGRIRSIALIHEQLYQYEHLSKIEFGRYIKSLAEGIDISFRNQDKIAQLSFNLEKMEIDVNIAIPLGLICNELIINCYKHSNQTIKSLSIIIHLYTEENKNILIIKDNGLGLPPDFKERQKLSLGYKIIDSLIYQLKGSLDFIPPEEGTTIKIQF